MGRTSKPLRILVGDCLADTAEIRELGEKGHVLFRMRDVVMPDPCVKDGIELSDFDLILSPNAWRMTPELIQFLDVAVKAARKEKYGGRASDE